MNSFLRRVAAALLCGAGVLLAAAPAQAQMQIQPTSFSFGVFAPAAEAASDDRLQRMISESDDDNLAFVVATGLRRSGDACSDDIYEQRKAALQRARNGLVVSIAATDWADCRNARGRSIAQDRLGRLRELLFADEFSLGATRLPLVRQSNSPRFRSYSENTRWQIGDVLFVTLNLPANNNHYVTDAGRNSEFEDRSFANRSWISQAFHLASHRKLGAIVVFCDGNPMATTPTSFLPGSGRRDGFADIRKAMQTLAGRFSGKLLVVYRQSANGDAPSGVIRWQGNIGTMEARTGWSKVTVVPGSDMQFEIERRYETARSGLP